METVDCLSDLTKHPAGLLVWPSMHEGFFMVWAGFSGIPRVFGTGIVGYPAKFEKSTPKRYENITVALNDIVRSISVDIPDNVITMTESVLVYDIISDIDETLFAIVPEAPPETVSAIDYSKKMGLNYNIVCRKCRSGKIPAVKIGAEWKIFIKNKEVKT